MQVTVFPPSAPLAPFVRRFVVIETTAEATRTLLPDQGLMLGLRYAGASSLITDGVATRVANASISGVLRTARTMRTSAHSGVVVTAFRETGAAAFFVEPLHALFGRTTPLDELIPHATVERVEQALVEASSHAARVALVEQFLLARLAPERADPIAAAAVAAIRRARGVVRIAALARELGISQDPLEKRFRRAVGASPKHLASLVRLSHVIDAQRWLPTEVVASRGARTGRVVPPTGRPEEGWARRAIAAGYFDQSHFIREFRAVTGDAPERFFRAGDYC